MLCVGESAQQRCARVCWFAARGARRRVRDLPKPKKMHNTHLDSSRSVMLTFWWRTASPKPGGRRARPA